MSFMTSLAFSGRRGHFEGLNWDEEDQRSQKGEERRREQKKQKRLSRMADPRLAANENERGRREAFIVLLREDLRPRILAACDDRSLQVNVTWLLTEVGVGRHGGDLARRLRAFQIDGNDYVGRCDRLNETGHRFLSILRNHPAFVSVSFFSPPGHVSDSSDGKNSLADRLEAEMLGAQQQQQDAGGGPDDALAADGDDVR